MVLGRPKGHKNKAEKYKLYGKGALIEDLLQRLVPKREIALACHVCRNTLEKFLRQSTYASPANEQ